MVAKPHISDGCSWILQAYADILLDPIVLGIYNFQDDETMFERRHFILLGCVANAQSRALVSDNVVGAPSSVRFIVIGIAPLCVAD